MKSVHLGELKSFVVFSDVHLRGPNEELSHHFINTLRELPPCDAVILLGDIFDFIFLPNRFFQEYWKEFFATCESLQRRGIRVVFVEGNHDFGFEHFGAFSSPKWFSVCGDCELVLTHPVLGTTVLRHGDDIVCRPGYLRFRAVVKSFVVQRVASIVPGCMMQAAFSLWARISRSRDKYRSLENQFLKMCLHGFLAQTGENRVPNVLVIGHIHMVLDDVVSGCRVLAGPSWLTEPGALFFYEDGSVERRLFTRKSLPATPPPSSGKLHDSGEV